MLRDRRFDRSINSPDRRVRSGSSVSVTSGQGPSFVSEIIWLSLMAEMCRHCTEWHTYYDSCPPFIRRRASVLYEWETRLRTSKHSLGLHILKSSTSCCAIIKFQFLSFLYLERDTYNASIQEFLLDLLDSMPRMQLSNDQMRMIIFVLKECGVPDVLSLETLRRVQDGLREKGSVPTTRHETERGNIFYVNDIGAQIAKGSLGAPAVTSLAGYYYIMLLLFPCSRIQSNI